MDGYNGYQGITDNSQQRLIQTITTNIQKISQNVTAMNKLVNPQMTVQDSSCNQLFQIQTYTQNLVKDTHSLVQEMMRAPIKEPAVRLVRERLNDEYITTVNAFQAVQRAAQQRIKEDLKMVKAKAGPIAMGPLGAPIATSSPKTELMIEMESSEERLEPAEQRKQQQLNIQVEQQIREVEARERNIRQLESDILDVNQIFKELGTMIHDQGATVDSIESSVEHTSHNVEQATHELRQASSYKNAARKKKVYLAIILTIIISIILIIVFSR